jgi:hypothetical protein
MPTVLQDGPYSFVFFSSDWGEPPHIHVKRDRQLAKFWLRPISLAKNRGFPDHERNQIERLVDKHHVTFIEA